MNTEDFKKDLGVEHIRGNIIENIAKSLMNLDKDDEITDEDLKLIFDLNLEFQAKELTISAGEKRQAFQFEPNDYHVSMKVDLGNSWNVIFDRVKNAKPEDRASEYQACKKIFYKLIAAQHSKNELFLRGLLRAQQAEDGIKR